MLMFTLILGSSTFPEKISLSQTSQSPQLLVEHHGRNNELFRLLVDSVKDYAIFVLDPEGHVLTWNPGAEAIKGYTRDEIVGHHFSRFYPAEAIESGWPARELALAQKEGR